MHTIIIGSGISGLAVANALLAQGIPKHEILVLEAASRPGGLIATNHKQGYLLESGPEGLRGNKEHVYNLIRMANAENTVIPSAPATDTRYLIHKHKLTKLPGGPLQALTTPLLSFKSKLRILKEPFVKPLDTPNEPIGDFLTRRFGKGLDPLLDAFISGVYAGDHKALNSEYVFPELKALERQYGSIIKGGIKAAKKAKKAKKAKNQEMQEHEQEQKQEQTKSKKKEKPPFLLSFQGGMGGFIQTLANNVNVTYNERVTSITRTTTEYTVQTTNHEYTAKHVVLAVNPHQVKTINIFNDPSTQSINIRRAPVAIVALGYDENDFKKRPKGYGFLAPSKENLFMLGTLFSSDIFPHHAPPGKILLRAFIGGIRHPERTQLSEKELITQTIDALHDLLPFKQDATPELTHVTYQREGIAQLEQNHNQIIAIKNKLEQNNPGFFITGIGWTGISTDHLIKEATTIAQTILNTPSLLTTTH